MAVVDDEPLSREDSSITYVAGAPGCGRSSCLVSHINDDLKLGMVCPSNSSELDPLKHL